MYRILNCTRIKPRSRPPQKKSAYFTHPDFSAAKIEKKVHKLREQIRYLQETITALFVRQRYLILSFSELCPFSFFVAKQDNRNVTYSFCLRLDVNACLL